uniref:Uncharacterized protein n=1 Tax=Panagrolaimus superbus TaxID=310955 RepID=A0A914Z9G5_9BILA
MNLINFRNEIRRESQPSFLTDVFCKNGLRLRFSRTLIDYDADHAEAALWVTAANDLNLEELDARTPDPVFECRQLIDYFGFDVEEEEEDAQPVEPVQHDVNDEGNEAVQPDLIDQLEIDLANLDPDDVQPRSPSHVEAVMQMEHANEYIEPVGAPHVEKKILMILMIVYIKILMIFKIMIK